MTSGFQAINHPPHNPTAIQSTSQAYEPNTSEGQSRKEEKTKKISRGTFSTSKDSLSLRPNSPSSSSPNPSLPCPSSLFVTAPRKKPECEGVLGNTVLERTTLRQKKNRRQSVLLSETPQDQPHGKHLAAASPVAQERGVSMSLGVPEPESGDRIGLCREVKILPTVERSPVRPRTKKRTTSGPSPHHTSSDYVPTGSEPSEKPIDRNRHLQKPGSSPGSAQEVAAEPVVKVETQDLPDGRDRKMTKSSEVPPELLGLDQKHPQVKAYRSGLREQLRAVELTGLAESNLTIHNSEVIKNLKIRLKKYEELARQIQALQNEKLLSRDGKLFTMAKQLGLVHDDRRPKKDIDPVETSGTSHQASPTAKIADTASTTRMQPEKLGATSSAATATPKNASKASTVECPGSTNTQASQRPQDHSSTNSVPIGCAPRLLTLQAQDSSTHQAGSRPNAQQANEEPTETARQETFDEQCASGSLHSKGGRRKHRRKSGKSEQELAQKVDKHGRILGDGLRHTDNLMLGYGHRHTFQVQIPTSGLCSGDVTSDTTNVEAVHKPLNSCERRSLEWHARRHDLRLQNQHKREVRLARLGDQYEEVEDVSRLASHSSSDLRCLEGRQSEIPSWEFYNLPPTSRAMATPPPSSPRVVFMKSGTGTVEIIDMETPSPSPATTATGDLGSGKKRKRASGGEPLSSPPRKKQKHSPARQGHGVVNVVHDTVTTDLNDQIMRSEGQSPTNLEADDMHDGTQQPASSSYSDSSLAQSEGEARRRKQRKGKARQRSHSLAMSEVVGSQQDFEATGDDHSSSSTAPTAEVATGPLQELSTNIPRAQTMPPIAFNSSAPFLARHNFVSTEDLERLVSQAESKIKANMLKEFKILATATHQPAAVSSSSSMPPPPRPVTGQASGPANSPRILLPSLLSLPLEKPLEDEVVGLIKDRAVKGPTRVMKAGWAFTHKGDLRSCLLHCQSIRSRLSLDELAKVTPRKKLRAPVRI